ncbi:hypothetical protein Echvi_3744 [Echinicola vietnamensis DSM 17526]|uniref:Uncharacterized protein n=1 Tax=Echinicola vietnamensis (strain DSM 17526 / LMG 23754 / KMM 6221) TaxID=926556 RepID=L0G4L8_ECHVK|nr:hypothetical protein Echvi_3744 [Echinicola vietnamensis DSM 17526]
MLITSTNGFLSVVNSPSNGDHLLVRAKCKTDLSRLFDERRIHPIQHETFNFGIFLCKQEFADTLIKMIKCIDYTNFESGMITLD